MASTELGPRLKHFRQMQQLTQTELADKLHVSRQTVSSWETGRNQPDIATITQLATLYHLSVDAILLDTATTLSSPTKQSIQPSLTLPTVLLGILLVERITQFSNFSAFYWIDFLILLLLILIGNLLIAHHHLSVWTSRVHWIGLTGFALLSFISGSLNAFDMGFGLMTTCQFSGLVVAIVLVRKYWQFRSAKLR
ncbi:helix-turn-helix domain-containing protein [Levilactobacillus enshiensis]|uniref:helix-turn-helix domain-containing protein n=1 Tax=Levilactobacillus enshiensis TaxID=2590213 RepID=UPI00117ACEAD|nr:helix-turn-helix transcriptional regulator [Levilactobacillus enshiensis]